MISDKLMDFGSLALSAATFVSVFPTRYNLQALRDVGHGGMLYARFEITTAAATSSSTDSGAYFGVTVASNDLLTSDTYNCGLLTGSSYKWKFGQAAGLNYGIPRGYVATELAAGVVLELPVAPLPQSATGQVSPQVYFGAQMWTPRAEDYPFTAGVVHASLHVQETLHHAYPTVCAPPTS